MPQKRRLRVLLALCNPVALSAAEAYLRGRRECLAIALHCPVSAETLLPAISRERADLLLFELGCGTPAVGPVLESVRAAHPFLPVLAAIEAVPALAFQAARLGAFDVLTLPLTEQEMTVKFDAAIASIHAAHNTAAHKTAAHKTAAHKTAAHNTEDKPSRPAPSRASRQPALDHNGTVPEPFSDRALAEYPDSYTTSGRMAEIRATIEKVATTSATVLIRGESGVGKEIVARMIFARSERSQKPFVKLNCAAIPNELLESELFGFEAGAFTGAQRAKPGKFELADGGTMFLDEIAEMHPMLQAKLLHVLQDGEFSRLGSKHDTSVDVRVICATNKLIEQRVAEGLFREDLFYRINVVTIHVPPLRERTEEIPALVDYFVSKYSVAYKRSVAPIDARVMRLLKEYSWPGNIRELENLCKRYVIVGGLDQILQELSARRVGRPLSMAALVSPDRAAGDSAPALSLLEIGRSAARRAEREAIEAMLVQTHWNRKEAARRLHVSYKALLNKIEQIGREGGGQDEQRVAH